MAGTNGTTVAHNVRHQLGQATHTLEATIYNFLQWYTSFFYWGAGIALGLTTGWFYAIRSYVSTVIYDAFHFMERQPPAVVKQGTRVPEPASVPAAVTTTTSRAAAKTVAAAKAA